MSATQLCRTQFAHGLLGGVLSIRNFLYYRCMLYFTARTFIIFLLFYISICPSERDMSYGDTTTLLALGEVPELHLPIIRKCPEPHS